MADAVTDVPSDDKYDLTIDDVADFFGVTAGTVQRWVASGRLRGTRTPGSTEKRAIWRFQRSELHRFAEANSTRQAEAAG